MTTIRLIKNNKKDINNTNNDRNNNDNEFLVPRVPLHFLSQPRRNFCQQIASPVFNFGRVGKSQFCFGEFVGLGWFTAGDLGRKIASILRKMMCSLYPPVAGCETFNSWPSHFWDRETPIHRGNRSLWNTADSPTWKPCRECIAMRWRCHKNQFCWWLVFGHFFLSRKRKKKRQILYHPRKRGNIFPPNREVFVKIIDDSKVPRCMVGDMWCFRK